MATLSVSLSDLMNQWVESQARTGPYRDASGYVRDLIRRDQERTASLAELQGLITEGLQSGVSDQSKDKILQTARERARSMLQP